MEKTTNDKRADFKIKLNYLINLTQEMLDSLKEFSYGAIVIPNCAKLYRDKILDIDDLFVNNGLDWYSESFIRNVVDVELLGNCEYSMYLSDVLIDKLRNPINRLSLIFGSGKLCLSACDKALEYYHDTASKIGNYDIQKELYKTMIKFLQGYYGGNNQPGFFEEQSIRFLDIASQIEAIQTEDYNEEVLAKIVAKKEIESLRHYKYESGDYTDEDAVKIVFSQLECITNMLYKDDDESRMRELERLYNNEKKAFEEVKNRR